MTTTQRGYDYRHKQRRAALIAAAIGQPCALCGDPMRSDQHLDLDHPVPLVWDPTSIGTRIVHAHCNRGRRPLSPVA